MRRVLVGLLAASVLILLPCLLGLDTGGQALAGPARRVYDPGEMGPFAVGFTSFQLIDPSRPGDGATYAHRPIPVYVWYPVDQPLPATAPLANYPLDPLYGVYPPEPSSTFEKYGLDRAYQSLPVSSLRPFPLLIFSPGWGNPAWAHVSLGTRLASHGIVVAVAYHFGDWVWEWEPPLDNIAVASYNRPRDLSFALTDLLVKNLTTGHLLFGAMRPDQVAAGGHSLGGYAAMVLAGGDDSVCDTLYGMDVTDPPPWTCAPSPPDPRIKAIVPHDGSGWILHFDELARIKVPACGLNQEWGFLADEVQQGLLPPGYEAWAARQHAAYQGHPAYRVDLTNTPHLLFSDFYEVIQIAGDIGYFPPDLVAFLLDYFFTGFTPPAEVHALVSKYTIAFLKTNLAGEQGYQNILTPGWALTKEPLIEFFVTEKRNPKSIDDDWPEDFIYFPHQPGSDQARAEKDPTAKLRVPRLSLTR